MAQWSGIDTGLIKGISGLVIPEPTGEARTFSPGTTIAIGKQEGQLHEHLSQDTTALSGGRYQLWSMASDSPLYFKKVVSNMYQQYWGITTDGKLYYLHLQNNFSSLGIVTTWTQYGTDTDWEDVGAGQYHVMLIKAGVLYGIGYNSNGQYGSGSTSYYTVPTVIGSFTDWVKVDCGTATTCAIREVNGVGKLYVAGRNASYGTGLGTQSGNTVTLTEITGTTDVTAVSAGYNGYLFIDDGAVYGAGYNNANAMGFATTGTRQTPAVTTITSGATHVAYGYTRCLAIANGALYTAGYSIGNFYWADGGSHTSGWEFDTGYDFTDILSDGVRPNNYVGMMEKGGKHYLFSNSLHGYILNDQTIYKDGQNTDAIEDWAIWSDAGVSVDSVTMASGYGNNIVFITFSS